MSLDAIHRSVVALLQADAGLVAMLTQARPHKAITAYDIQPNQPELDTDFPNITIGQMTQSSFNAKQNEGGDALVQVDVWTRERGYSTVQVIADRVRLALERQDMPGVSGFIDCQYESTAIMSDPDGKTRHAAMLFRVTYLP